tara:strand:- start:2840 stop:3310 length:471 start_codon:yes stop_codon:yes gene_type:complete
MNNIKKFWIFIGLFLIFSSCGYKPIFSKKDVNFTIENIEFFGDRLVGEKINISLSGYKNKPNKEKKINLVIKNLKGISVASKNPKGEAQTKRINIDTNVEIILEGKNVAVKNFNKSTVYSIVDRKSEQTTIENKLTENLSKEISLQIIFEILKNTK